MFTPDNPRPVSPALRKVLDGSVDLHCHSGPSPFPRRFNHLEAAHDAARIGMRAILVKSHHHNTVMDLLALGPWLADAPSKAFGGIALNSQVGGINPSAVAMSLKMGGRGVWGPTFSSQQHIDHHKTGDSFPTSGLDMPEGVVGVIGDDGEATEDTRHVVALVAEADALLTGGHMGYDGVKTLFTAALEAGVKRLVVNHPDFIANISHEQAREFVGMGAYIEHSIAMYDPQNKDWHWPIERLLEWIDAVGPDHTSLGSDLGQVGNPLPVDGFIFIAEALLDNGVSERDVKRMIAGNPAYLIGLEDAAR